MGIFNISNYYNWFNIRHKTKYKCNYDNLTKSEVLNVYNSYSNYVKLHLKIEIEKNKRIGRIPNFPEHISENAVIHILKYINPNEDWTWNCKGDIFCRTTNTRGEVKACQHGPTSFTPKKDLKKDTLFYLDCSKHLNDSYFELYRIDKYYSTLKDIKINSEQTFEDQQNQNRRARIDFKKFPDFDSFKVWSGKLSDILTC